MSDRVVITFELVEKARAGDAQARDVLVRAMLPSVEKLASLFSRKRRLGNDLIQEGILAVLQSLDKFDPTRGVSFKTFAIHRARGAMMTFLKRERPHRKGRISRNLDNLPSPERSPPIGLNDMLPDGVLSAKESEVVSLYFGFDGRSLTQEEIAAPLGTTQQHVSVILCRAARKLRESLPRGDFLDPHM